MLVPGKVAVKFAPPTFPANRLFSDTASCRTLLAACTTARPLSIVSNSFSALTRAAVALAGQAFMPSPVRSKPGTKLADWTMLPAQKMADPAMEIDAGKRDVPLAELTASTLRPAQPVPPEPLASPVCICTIWSLCEI